MKYSREGILSHWAIWIQIGEFTYEAEYLKSDDASYNQIVAESGGVLKVTIEQFNVVEGEITIHGIAVEGNDSDDEDN